MPEQGYNSDQTVTDHSVDIAESIAVAWVEGLAFS
jgi:hypothetical protein